MYISEKKSNAMWKKEEGAPAVSVSLFTAWHTFHLNFIFKFIEYVIQRKEMKFPICESYFEAKHEQCSPTSESSSLSEMKSF